MAKKQNKRKPTPDQPPPQPTEAEVDLHELASVVTARAEILDVILESSTSRRASEAGKHKLQVNITVGDIQVGRQLETGRILIKPSFLLEARSEQGGEGSEPLVSVGAVMIIIYKCDNLAEIPEESLHAFAKTNAVFNAWSFWREFVMNTTARMRLKPIIVPLFRL